MTLAMDFPGLTTESNAFLSPLPDDKADPSISGSESSTSEDFSSAVSSSTPVSASGHIANGGGHGGQAGVNAAAAAAHLSALSSGVIPPGVFQSANHGRSTLWLTHFIKLPYINTTGFLSELTIEMLTIANRTRKPSKRHILMPNLASGSTVI